MGRDDIDAQGTGSAAEIWHLSKHSSDQLNSAFSGKLDTQCLCDFPEYRLKSRINTALAAGHFYDLARFNNSCQA